MRQDRARLIRMPRQINLIGVLFIAAFCFRGAAQTLPSAVTPTSITAVPVMAEGLVGSERCRSCHKAEFVEFTKTKHAELTTLKDAAAGCETCHGPGKAHVEGEAAARGDDTKIAAAAKLIFSFRGKPAENSKRCMTCHVTSLDQSKFQHSTHSMHGVSCNDCHSTHLVEHHVSAATAQAAFFSTPRIEEEKRWLHSSLLKKPQPELCFGCHTNIQSQFALPTHHRVPEGAMKCTDCHNTHGTSNRATLRQSGWETCVQCHVEKRGPFVFEHSAVKVEGCVACHTPHGSVNKALLARREERFLCLQCHVDPFAANVPHGRQSFQTRGDCTRCHASIHGSNFDANFLH
jgi:predicted CXXCH cytochrome family protein